MASWIHDPRDTVTPELVLFWNQDPRATRGRSLHGLIAVLHVNKDHNGRAPVRSGRSARQRWPFRLNHDHRRTDGQQRVCNRPVWTRAMTEFHGSEHGDAELNRGARIPTDQSGNDDRRIVRNAS
jgi:hypothetical protein